MENNTIVKNAVEFVLFNYFGLSHEDGHNAKTILDKAIELAYVDATNQGAFNTLFTNAKFPDREIVDKFKMCVKGSMSKLIKERIELYFFNDKDEFDKWHTNLCEELVKKYGEICEKHEIQTFSDPSGFFSYGNAQKWVNMTIKNLYVISGAYLAMGGFENEALFNAIVARSDKYHIPLDNLILGAICEKELIKDKDYFVKKYGKKDPSYKIAKKDDKGKVESFPWSDIKNICIYTEFRNALNEAIGEPPIEWECNNWIERKKQINILKGDLTTIDDQE